MSRSENRLNIYRRKSFTNQTDACHTLTLSADSLILESEAAERCFIAEGWFDPFEANNSAVDADITDGSFTSREHAYLFGYLILCAESNTTPSVDIAVKFAEEIDAPVTLFAAEIDALLLGTQTEPGAIGSYAEAVADYRRKRDRVSELILELRPYTRIVTEPQSKPSHAKPSNHRLVRIRTAKGSRRVKYV